MSELFFNPLSVNATKWSKTLKQFVSNEGLIYQPSFFQKESKTFYLQKNSYIQGGTWTPDDSFWLQLFKTRLFFHKTNSL